MEVHDLSPSTPTYFTPHKSKKSAWTSSAPDSHTPHTPSGSTSRRHKPVKRAKSGNPAGDDTTDSTLVATPTDDNPPARKQKPTHESGITENEGEGFSAGGAVERNDGARDGREQAEGQEDKEGEEGSAGMGKEM